ncbi:O-fucosyltransferase 1-like [Musa acuminata AAA Group]|uniref:O-fucosyltransferase 1-like n=1 Tax=Musa acuminata AAA Group TaxID=214697 RepID=UPI0031D6F83C
MRRGGGVWSRRNGGPRQLKQGLKGMPRRLSISIAVIVLIICFLSLLSIRFTRPSSSVQNYDTNKLWKPADSDGWRSSSAPRSYWPPPPNESNGYLRVRCNGGLNQQRSAICNAVVAARIMNATLVLPELDTNSFWHDESGFAGIYDAEHFIGSLRYDIHIVQSLPVISVNGKRKKIRSFQIHPPRDAPLSWYTTTALKKMREHGSVYLTPFSHRLAEEIDDPELQRLRCRVNYHALRFKPHIMKISSEIVNRLRSEGHFMSIHLRFEMDMLAFAGCLDIFTPEEQKILIKYRKKNFAEKELVYRERRLIGKCPLTPEEVGLVLQAMGFNNSARIYLAAGELFGGERFIKPFRAMFPHLENHSTVGPSEKLEGNARGLVGSAVDYMVSLLSDIFIPTYDGPSNFANNLMGHRLYYGFRTTIQPNRKALAPIFMDREKGHADGFEERIRQVMFNSKFGRPHKRVHPESFYTNSWPECFCLMAPANPADKCPPHNILEILHGQLQSQRGNDSEPAMMSYRIDSSASQEEVQYGS